MSMCVTCLMCACIAVLVQAAALLRFSLSHKTVEIQQDAIHLRGWACRTRSSQGCLPIKGLFSRRSEDRECCLLHGCEKAPRGRIRHVISGFKNSPDLTRTGTLGLPWPRLRPDASAPDCRGSALWSGSRGHAPQRRICAAFT